MTRAAADLLKLNPLSGVFEGYRAALLYGETPALWTFAIPLAYCALSFAVFIPLYRRESRHFAKVVE